MREILHFLQEAFVTWAIFFPIALVARIPALGMFANAVGRLGYAALPNKRVPFPPSLHKIIKGSVTVAFAVLKIANVNTAIFLILHCTKAVRDTRFPADVVTALPNIRITSICNIFSPNRITIGIGAAFNLFNYRLRIF